MAGLLVLDGVDRRNRARNARPYYSSRIRYFGSRCEPSAMAKRPAIIGIFSLAVGMIVDARTAWGFQLTCSGYLTNTREVGVTLDKCDLNFISVKDSYQSKK